MRVRAVRVAGVGWCLRAGCLLLPVAPLGNRETGRQGEREREKGRDRQGALDSASVGARMKLTKRGRTDACRLNYATMVYWDTALSAGAWAGAVVAPSSAPFPSVSVSVLAPETA